MKQNNGSRGSKPRVTAKLGHKPSKRAKKPRLGDTRCKGLSVIGRMVATLLQVFPPHLRDDGQKLHGALLGRQFDRAVAIANQLAVQMQGSPYETWVVGQVAGLVRKVPFKHPGLDPEATARKKFLKAEHRCKRVNALYRAEDAHGVEKYSDAFALARKYILDTIGAEPPLMQIYENCGFGPGASYGVHGDLTSFVQKVGVLTVTPSCVPFARAALWANYQLREYLVRGFPCCELTREVFNFCVDRHLVLVQANKITFVAKTAETHRSIAIEPTLNGFLQHGVEFVLSMLLARVRIDLSDQTFNQRLAQAGSCDVSNPWVTIDLSAASDSLSIGLVRRLLPPAWYRFLDAIRSPAYELDGAAPVRYEKFTSMGNGFCFPLETLIFASLAYAANVHSGPERVVKAVEPCKTRKRLQDIFDRNHFKVYGDDIIVRQCCALYLIELLSRSGFRVNRDKTFVFGPFRESCGADYFRGINVRPLVLDEIPEKSRDLYKILNGLRLNPRFFWDELWTSVYSSIPYEDRLLRPIDGPADSAITVPLDMFMTSRFAQWSRDLQGWRWRELLSASVESEVPDDLALLGALLGNPAKDGRPVVAYRRKTTTRSRVVPDDRPTHKCDALGFGAAVE